MLTTEQIIEKLFKQPDLFYHYFYKKRYTAAYMIEERARATANFIELDEDKKIELFGSRELGQQGLFAEDDVLKANLECILQSQMDRDITLESKKNREEMIYKDMRLKQKEQGDVEWLRKYRHRN